MKLYKIREWAALFENNRSRTVKELAWVPIPNRHDGEHFSMIMDHERGAEIFAAWVLLLQVASRCQPRGTLLRDNKKPHTPASLSKKTRAPENWFVLALDFLENHTDWLEISKDCQEGDTVPSPSCQSGDEEGKGMELKEEKGTCSVFSEEPSWSEFWEYCKSPHCGIAAEWFARDKFQAQDIKGWNEVRDWRKFALRVRGWWDNDGRPMTPPSRNGQASKKPIHHLRDMTYDARTPEQIAEQEARGLR